MASTTSVHSRAVAYTLRPFLRRQAPFLLSCYSRHFLTSIHLNILCSHRRECPVQPAFAHARRSIASTAKDDTVASPVDLLFKAPLKIVEYPDLILRAKNRRVITFDDSLKNLVHEMFDIMYKTDGIGLSAPQVGINVKLMVFNTVGERGEGEEIVLVNPLIKRFSRKMLGFNEGCLSFPGIYADLERPHAVQVDAQDINGVRFEVNLTGLPARVFQHEYDHLQGILFFDRMSDEVVDTICAELQSLEKKYEETTGLPSPERIDMRRRKKKAVGFGKQMS